MQQKNTVWRLKPICLGWLVHYASGGWYKGEATNGFKEGQGEEMMQQGVRYVGGFKRDRFDGSGEMIWPNGNRLSGDWRDSKLVGIGVYTQNTGESLRVRQTERGVEPAP